ncbi:MAG: MFS transporter [Chloroflexota bacterium]
MKRALQVQIPLFIAVRTLLNTSLRMVYPFLPVFARGLGVDLRLLSLGLTLRWSSGLLGPFLAWIGDTRGRKAGMLFGLSLFVLSAGLVAVWPTYPAFVIALILSLVGNITLVTSMQAYLGDQVPYRQRGLALGLIEFSWSLGFIVGVPLVGLLIARHGWQAPFPILALLGVLALAGLWRLLPADKPEISSRPNMGRNLLAVIQHPAALAGAVLGICMSSSNEMVNLIFGVWLEDSLQVKIAALAGASAVIGLSELGGESLVSFLVDRLGKARSVSLGLLSNALVALALPTLGQSLSGALLGLFLLYLTFEFTMVSAIPLMTEVLPGSRATFMSVFFASTALGRGISDMIAPSLYEFGKTSPRLPGLQPIVLAAIVLNLFALICLGFVRRAEPES